MSGSDQPASDGAAGLRRALDEAAVVLFGLDERGVLCLSEGRDAFQLGLGPEVIGRPLLGVWEGRAQLAAAVRRALGGAEAVSHYEHGGRCWEVRLVPSAPGAATHVAGSAIDVTERRREHGEISRLAFTDGLTELPNRLRLEREVSEAVARSKQTGEQLAVLFIDLDDFKLVNDGYGHAAGDELLTMAAQRLTEPLRPRDMLARQGGDEFIVLLRHLNEPARWEAAAVADQVLRALTEPFVTSAFDVQVGASVGISLFPGDGGSASELLANADAAMYRAKGEERNGFCFFEGLAEDPRDRLRLARRLHEAVEQQSFELFYQPIVRVSDRRIVALEALLRWRTPEGALEMPSSFLPLADRTGLIDRIGPWVVERAAEQGRAWRSMGVGTQISVNLSPRELRRPRLARDLTAALARAGLDPRYLALEITESGAMGSGDGLPVSVQRLVDAGFGLALDDFGTGLSSLSRLRDLPVGSLKIDRSFMAGIPADAEAAAVVRAICELASGLGRHVVAEGVERDEQLAFLREHGCGFAQGFLVSPPVPAAEATRLLVAQARGGAAPRTTELAA